MQLHEIIKLSGIFLLVLFITGCAGSGSVKTYFQGFQGLEANFLKSNPKSAYEGEIFGIALTLNNLGTYTVGENNSGILSVNYDDYYYTISKDSKDMEFSKIKLNARSIAYPLGDQEYYEFLFEVKDFDILMRSVDTKINFNLCYPYRTELSTETCIDTRTRAVDVAAAPCKIKDYSSSAGQGSPVTITKIVPEMLIVGENVRPLYRIYVENRGKGYVINNTGKSDICSGENIARNANNLNRVSVNAWISNNTKLVCNPAELRLGDSENIVRCYVSDDQLSQFKRNKNNYITVLRVRLDYIYVDTKTVEMELKRINQVDIRSLDECGYYERPYNGSCKQLCEICAIDPKFKDCDDNLKPGDAFDSSFGCTCNKQKCAALSKDHQCIFGYCSGTSYCCSVNECRDKKDGDVCGDHNVCKNNRCMLNETLCTNKFGNLNYTCMNITNCDLSTKKTNQCDKGDNWVCCLPKKQ